MIISLAVLSANNVWVGSSGPAMALMYTEDGGVTWHERTFPGMAVGRIDGLEFVHPMVGWMLADPSSGPPRVLRTIDGGYTWEPIALPTTQVTLGLCAIDENTVFVAGNVEGTTGFVGKVFAA